MMNLDSNIALPVLGLRAGGSEREASRPMHAGVCMRRRSGRALFQVRHLEGAGLLQQLLPLGRAARRRLEQVRQLELAQRFAHDDAERRRLVRPQRERLGVRRHAAAAVLAAAA